MRIVVRRRDDIRFRVQDRDRLYSRPSGRGKDPTDTPMSPDHQDPEPYVLPDSISSERYRAGMCPVSYPTKRKGSRVNTKAKYLEIKIP